MEKLLESALKNDSKTSKSDFLKIFYSCLEDESFLDEFRAYMKQYMFHSLKQSKLKFLTEPTQAIKCHSVSPKIQSMNLLIADYLLRQDFLYTLSVFSSEAPNLKNLTSFSHYINCLAETSSSVQEPHHVPKLMSRDVKDIIECLGLSPHCDESVEARQQYMDCDDNEPLLLCLLSTVIATLQSIDRCPRCKVSHRKLKDQTMYKYCDNIQPSSHFPGFNPWQNEICQLLHQYSVDPSEVFELVQKMTVIIKNELETAESKIESHLTDKEEQLRRYEEMLSKNLEEAERHLLLQKQSLEQELVKKQKELQEVARILSKKKANIAEAVNILQKQKDLLTEKETEFNTMMTTMNEQLEVRARSLDAREEKMNEGFDKLSRQKETFYERLLKLCSSKTEYINEISRNVKLRSPPNEHGTIMEPNFTNNIKAVEEGDSKRNRQRFTKSRYPNIAGEMSGDTNEPKTFVNGSKHPNDLNDRTVEIIEENVSTHLKKRKQLDLNDKRIEENINHAKKSSNYYDLKDRVVETVEENINRINSQDLIALLKTIQVQSEAMKGFLEERRKNVSKQNSDSSAEQDDEYRQVQDGSQCTNGIMTRAKHSISGKCVRVMRNEPSLSALGDSCRVNDENTICDRCGSEVILKFHINEKGQKSAPCDKSISSRTNNYLSPIEDRSVDKSPSEDKGYTTRYDSQRDRVRRERSDAEISRGREREDTAKLQSQMAELMTRFEKLSANQNGVLEKERAYSNKEALTIDQRYGQHFHNKMNPGPTDQETVYTLRPTVDTTKYQHHNTDLIQAANVEDPVELSRQTLARLSSQISALDESFDKYRDKIRKENEPCDSERNDMRRLEKLLSQSSTGGKGGKPIFSKHQQSHRSYLHSSGTKYSPQQTSGIYPSSIDPPTKIPTLRFKNARTGSLFPRGKHQQVPPYFSHNPSFWRSYLKTYHVPADKNKTWQEHFQDFAGQVNRDIEEMKDSSDNSKRKENGMVDRVLDHASDGSDSRSTSNSANDQTNDERETARITKRVMNVRNDQIIKNVHIAKSSSKSNQTNKSNRFLDQLSPNMKTKDLKNQNTVVNGHIPEKNPSLDKKTYTHYNRLDTENDGQNGQNDHFERVKTGESDENQSKVHLPKDEKLETEYKENSKQIERKEKQEETHRQIDKLLPTIGNIGDKCQNDFHSAGDGNVDCEDDLTRKELTSELQQSCSEDAKGKDQDTVESPKNLDDNMKNVDSDKKNTSDDAVVEYNTRGSLLFHMQDSDGSIS